MWRASQNSMGKTSCQDNIENQRGEEMEACFLGKGLIAKSGLEDENQ